MSRSVQLGDEVRDKVTGFQGIVVAKYIYLQGCTRVCVQPRVNGTEMKLPDAGTFDEPNLEVVREEVVTPGPQDTGGPEKWMPKDRPTGERR